MRMHFAVKVILAVILFIILLLHSAVYIGRDLAADWLLDQGAEYAGIERLKVGWFTGEVRLEGVDVRTPGQRDLKLESLYLKLDLSALTEQRVWIRQLDIRGLSGEVVELQQGEQKGTLQIGPVLIPAAGKEETPAAADEVASEWLVGISKLSIQKLDWKTDLPAQKHHLQLTEAGLEGLYFWEPLHASQLNLSGALNAADFSISGDVIALADDKLVNLKVSIAPLALQAFTSVAVPGLKGKLSTDLALHLKLSGDSVNLQQKGLLKLESFAWKDAAVDVQQQAVSWKGQIDVAIADGGLKDARLEGALKGSQTNMKLGDTQQVALAKLSWQGHIDATMESLQQKGKLGLEQLRWQDTGLDVRQQQLNWQGDLALALPQQQLKSLQLNGTVTGGGTRVEQGSALQLVLQKLNWQGKVALNNNVKTPKADSSDTTVTQQNLSVTGDSLQLDGLTVHNRKVTSDLLKLATLSLQKIQFEQQSGTADDGMRVQLGETTVSGIQAQHKKPLSKIDSLRLQQLAYDSRGEVKISKVTLRGSQSHVVIAKVGEPTVINGYLAALSGLGGDQATELSADKAAKKKSAKAPAIRVRIGELAMAGKNQILFTDNNADPAFKGDVLIKSASLKQLDTASKKSSPFVADLELKPFTKLKLRGKTNLAGGGGDADWDASLTQLELPRLSPYAIESIGYFIGNGQMEVTSKGTLRNEQIEGENNIVINRLSVDPVNQDKVAGFTKQLSMPLGTAIMILQDDDDNIELDVPISGSLSDPDFGLDSVVKILAGKGLKQAAFSFLAKSLQPYGALISLAQTAIDAASDGTFINLEPVAFTPGSAQLNGKARDYLTKVESMLKERKAMRLNICGQAVAKDATVLNAKLLEANTKREEPLTEEQLAAELKAQLAALAQSRNDSVKRQLSKQVSGERLFVCFALPKLDDPKAVPVATLGL